MNKEQPIFTEEEKLKIECWDRALNCYGYSYIFSKRSHFYNKWNRTSTLLGIMVPLAIGGIATGYGKDSIILNYFIYIAIPLSITQLLISGLSLVNNWNDYLSYSFDADKDYNLLSEEYKKLAKSSYEATFDFKKQFEALELKYQIRSESDIKYFISDRERRMGMRWALREFKRKCVGCNEVPISMESTECAVCGNFRMNVLKSIFTHG